MAVFVAKRTSLQLSARKLESNISGASPQNSRVPSKRFGHKKRNVRVKRGIERRHVWSRPGIVQNPNKHARARAQDCHKRIYAHTRECAHKPTWYLQTYALERSFGNDSVTVNSSIALMMMMYNSISFHTQHNEPLVTSESSLIVLMTSESSPIGSCVLLSIWHLIVRIIPRNSITAFSMSPFDSLSPFTAPSVVTSALHIAATRFLNAIIAGSMSLFNVISR